MANKINITNKIGTFPDNGENTAAQFREFMGEFNDAIFPEKVIFNSVAGADAFSTPSNAALFPYNIEAVKVGGLVHLKGWVRSSPNEIVSSPTFLTFPEGDPADRNPYFPAEMTISSNTILFQALRGNPYDDIIRMEISNIAGVAQLRSRSAIPETLNSNNSGRFFFTAVYPAKY